MKVRNHKCCHLPGVINSNGYTGQALEIVISINQVGRTATTVAGPDESI